MHLKARFSPVVLSVALSFFAYFSQVAFACKELDKLAPDSITSLSSIEKLKQKMMASEPDVCKPYLDDLDIVKVKYIGFDEKEYTGIIIIHRELSQDILEIFQTLFKYQFPIGNVHPSGSKSNTTIAYNCRAVTNQAAMLSQHSYGRAIDINPLINPYVKDEQVIPKEGTPYIDRNQDYKGMITRESLVYELFVRRGWDWGGDWYDVGDYQHFEKRANGEKRNPFGYD